MASPYEVAIHLSVTGNAQPGVAGISKEINKLNDGVKNLHKAFALLFVGGEMKRFGEEVLGGVKKVLDAAGNFQQVQSQMTAMGMTQKEIGEAVSGSWKKAADNIHIGVQEIAQMNRHAIEIFGNAQAAAEHMPEMTKLAEFQARWGAGKTRLKQVDVSMAIRDMAKTTEGAAMLQKDPKVFDKFADNLMRSLIAAGGNVSATQYLQAQRTARAAAFGWSDSFRFGVFPAMVQEYGPNAGVMSQMAFKKLSAGTLWAKTGIVQGIEMGLIDPNKVEYDKVGRPLRLMPGALPYAAEFAKDPLKFTEKRVTPWLDKHTTDIAELTGALSRLMGNSTASSALIAYDTQAYKLEKDRENVARAKMSMPEGYDQALLGLQEKWQDFIIAVGTPSLKAATDALGGMTKAIISLTGAAIAHPGAAKDLLAITTGVGVALTAFGALAVSAGIVGLLGGGAIIGGIAALTGGLAGLAAAEWPTIASHFKQFLDSLRNTNWNEEITKALMPAIAAIKEWFSTLGAAIMDSLKGMWENMKGALGNLFHINYEGGGFGGGSGSGGGRGGTINASYGNLNATQSQVKDYITQAAIARGIDPAIARQVSWNESKFGAGWWGDRAQGGSYGPYQDFMGGGLGNKMLAAGIDPRNKGDWKRAVDWNLDYAARTHSWEPWHGWHGAAGAGLGGAHPVHLPPKSDQGAANHHHHIYLDGTKIATYVSKRFVRAAQYPTSVGRQDGRGTFMGPGAEVFA